MDEIEYDAYGREFGDFFFGQSKEFEKRWNDLDEAGLANFDCHLVQESLDKGWSIERTVQEGEQIWLEQLDREYSYARDMDAMLDHDYSMNG